MEIAGRILVTGGTGYTGRRLLRVLREREHEVRVLLRPTSLREGLPSHLELVEGDLEDGASLGPALRGVRVVLHLAHVRFGAALVSCLDGDVERLVAVSSLRAVSRVPSSSVAEVLAGEAAVSSTAPPWTILRPSMIFGPGDDRNISRLAARLRRSTWVPVVGAGRLHQPVFVDDVVDAVLAAAAPGAPERRTYAIAGPRPLTCADLVDAVGAAVGVTPRQVRLPSAPLAAALGTLERLGVHCPVAAEQVRRMDEDKAYDIGPAVRDLGFAPRPFPEALAQIYGPEGG